MTDSDRYTRDEPLVLPARLEEVRHYTPWWTGLLSPIQTFVSLLPAHKNSRRGRKAARRFKLVVGIGGLATIVFGAPNWMAVVGGVVLLVMTALPLPEVRKRGWQNQLKRLAGEQSRRVTRPARIIFDGHQLTLDKEGSTLRCVDLGGGHRANIGRIDGRYYLQMIPSSGETDQTIWIGTESEPEQPLPDWVEMSHLEGGAVERQCLLDSDDWIELVELMGQTIDEDA